MENKKDKLDIIFEPLYTSDEGRKVAGLGLANCREIISAHDGKIYARNAENGGLSICMEFNRAPTNKIKREISDGQGKNSTTF